MVTNFHGSRIETIHDLPAGRQVHVKRYMINLYRPTCIVTQYP